MKVIKRVIKTYMKFKLCTILIFLGLFLDTVIKINGKALIYVGESFVTNIYAATFTIAALSGTVLSIIISSLDNNYYGFTVKEI